MGKKRNPIYDENESWVDTLTLDVTDLAGQERGDFSISKEASY